MHFNTPKSKRRISIKKKRYTVNLSINLRGNVGNISLKFYCDSMWFRIDSFFSRDKCFFLSIHIQNTIVLSSHSKQTRKTNEYISQSARGQLSAWLESSSISFFCRRAENVLTSLENLPISSTLFVPKNFDRFSPIKENLSSNIYIYRYLSVAQY